MNDFGNVLIGQVERPHVEFLRMHAVQRMTGLGRSTIYRLIAQHKFPCQVQLASRAVGWRRSDLERWSESRPTTGTDI